MLINKKILLIIIVFIVIGGVSLLISKVYNDDVIMDKFKKEITNQNTNNKSKTLEEKLKESWLKNNPNTKIVKSSLNTIDKNIDKEFTIAYLQDENIKIAVITAMESQGQIDFIVEKNIVTDGQKLIDLKYINIRGQKKPSLLLHVVTADGFHYLSIYGEDKEELLRVGGNGGIMVKDLNGDNIPEVIPVTKTGQTAESSIINVYQWINNRFIEVDNKKYLLKNFSSPEEIIKYFFRVLHQGNKELIKSCFSKEVQRNFTDNDFSQLARLYKGNAKLINLSRDDSDEYRIDVFYKSNITRGKIIITLTREKGNWLINDVPAMFIPGKTIFKG